MTTKEVKQSSNVEDVDESTELLTLAERYSNEVRVCIAIQKLGKATVEEVEQKLDSEGIIIKESKISKACTNLQKRGLVSLNYDNSSGYAVKAYSMAKSIFSRDIPIAHYKDVVDTNDESIKTLLKSLEEPKKTNKGKMPDIRDYFLAKVKFKVVDCVLGFMPFTEEGFNQHYRQGKEVVLLAQHFRAWVRSNLRIINKTESLKDYIGFNYGTVKLNGKIEVMQFPILDGHQGKGIIKYESIPSGSIIETSFRVPGTEFTSEEFKKFLEIIGESPLRGFGGRSMTGYGRLEIVEFDVQ